MADVMKSSTTAMNLFGPGEQQHAGDRGNLIAPQISGVQKGGRRRRGSRRTGKSGKRGGQGLTEIAVPALLLTANHLYGRKTQGAPKKFGKRRFSRRRGRSFRRGGRPAGK